MILTVTLNAALDVTYELGCVAWNAENRVAAAMARAGGKGINVARVLAALGADVVVTGFAGGATGSELKAELALAGIPDELVTIAGESRRTLAIVSRDEGRTALFNEAGPAVEPAEWEHLTSRFHELVPAADAVVLSGSLPPGVPADAYGILATAATESSATVLLDADGDALRRGVTARPNIVTPNRGELGRAAGHPVERLSDVIVAAESLRAAGAHAVVVTLGAEGLLACTPEGRWRSRPYREVAGNPTGAGDAVAAALAAGVVAGRPWVESLAHATALSAAAVSCRAAGEFDPDAYRRHLERALVEPV